MNRKRHNLQGQVVGLEAEKVHLENNIEKIENELEEQERHIKEAYYEIERLNNDIKILLKENENKEKVILKYDNIIKEIKAQLDYLETYSSEEDVFEDMKRRLNNIEKILGDSSNE